MGLTESNGSLLLGLCLTSPEGRLPSGVNLAGSLGDVRADPAGLVGLNGGMWRARIPEKMNFFYLKWCVLVHSERYLMDVEDVLLENSEYSVRVMGLISFLLHYCIQCKQSDA